MLLAACTGGSAPPDGGQPKAGAPPLGTTPAVACPAPVWQTVPIVRQPAEGPSYLDAIATSTSGETWAGGHAVGGEGDEPILASVTGAAAVPARAAPPRGRITALASGPGAFWALDDAGATVLRGAGDTWSAAGRPAAAGATEIALEDIAVQGDTVWVAGSSDHADGTRTQLWRRSGATWQAQPAPARGTRGRLLGIAATSGAVIAVGRTEPASSSPRALVLHRDARGRWRQQPVDAPGEFSELNAVVARSARDAWAAGVYWDRTGAHTLLLRWNGSRWRRVAHPAIGASGQRGGPAPPFGPSIDALAASPGGDVWAAGTQVVELNEVELQERMLVMRFDGTRWLAVEAPETQGTADAIVALDGGDVLVAGMTVVDDRETATIVRRVCGA